MASGTAGDCENVERDSEELMELIMGLFSQLHVSQAELSVIRGRTGPCDS